MKVRYFQFSQDFKMANLSSATRGTMFNYISTNERGRNDNEQRDVSAFSMTSIPACS